MKKLKSAIYGIRYRLSFLYYYLFDSESRKRTKFSEIIYHLFSPTLMTVGKKNTTLIKEDDRFKYYKISGYNDEFIYPRSSPFYSLGMVISEARPLHWHYYEIPQTKVEEGDVVVDCGSAEGFFAFKNQYIAKQIYVMEPMPIFLDSLNALFGHKSNITILPLAAGDKCEKAYMNLHSEASSLDATLIGGSEAKDDNSLEIDVVTLDSIFYDKGIKIDYLKADIEGFEENMILGALNTIRMSKPKIAITTYHPGQDYKKLITIIKEVVPEYNYLAKGIDFDSGHPVMLHMWCN
jgi:FkbM family methyltransferase